MHASKDELNNTIILFVNMHKRLIKLKTASTLKRQSKINSEHYELEITIIVKKSHGESLESEPSVWMGQRGYQPRVV